MCRGLCVLRVLSTKQKKVNYSFLTDTGQYDTLHIVMFK